MPYKYSAPIIKEFNLEKTDAKYGTSDDPTVIKVRQVKMGDKKLRDDLYARFERRFEGTSVTVSNLPSLDDVNRKEVFLTLAACNILAADGKTSLFTFEGDRLKSEKEFQDAYGQLDADVAEEILDKVLEMNPMWNPSLGEGR